MRALEGITVLDLTRYLPGAVATMCLLRFGAEVIKIEPPGCGDPARHLTGSGLFAETNRGKKSIGINLKHDAGRAIFCSLVESADILVENFRPGVMDRLQLDYDLLSRLNPRLIYASLTGYGSTGPYAHMAGHDINYMAMSGVLDLLSNKGARCPEIPQIQIADISGGANPLVIGILLALQARHHTGVGQKVDVSMISGMTDLLATHLSARWAIDGSELLSGAYACYSLYRCADDRWVAVGALEPRFWRNLCVALSCESLIDSQFSSGTGQQEMKRTFAERFLAHTAEQWFCSLAGKDCCVTPVRSLAEAVSNGVFPGQSVGVGMGLSSTPSDVGEHDPPSLGQHTTELLKRVGMASEGLDQLRLNGAIE